MGRKKKVKKTEPEITPKTVVVEGTQSIGYQGTVEIGIKHGNRLIINKKYHNSGREPLFRFLANCLGGNITEALRPTKIRLFTYEAAKKPSENEVIPPNAFNWNDADVKKLTAITPFVTYNTTPFLQRVDESYTVTLHFSIPFAYISDTEVYAMGLYPNNTTNNTDASAYFLFADEEDSSKWKPSDLQDSKGDYTYIVNWTLAVSNSQNKQGA